MKLFVLLILLLSEAAIASRQADFNENTKAQSIGSQSADQTVSPVAENPDVESQVSGKYPQLNRQESLPLGAIQHAWDDAKAGAGVYQVNYNPRENVRLITREFMTTSVVFPAWEQISNIEVGDESSYRVTKPKPNILLIRPNEFVGVDSSITAIGESGLVYGFYVRSEGYNSENISDIKVYIRAPKPEFIKDGKKEKSGVMQGSLSEKTDYLDAVVFDPANLNFNFSMSGDKSIAPERVFSDGMRTWFDYGDRMGSKSLPTIYSIIDGVDTPINVTREGSKLVAQATGPFTLKSGQKITCVYLSD